MDLCERKQEDGVRHPWELSRIATLQHILRDIAFESSWNVLDVGCGDGFTAQQITKGLGLKSPDGLDVYLTPEHLQELAQSYPSSQYVTNPDDFGGKTFQLMLFLDVLEHVEQDQRFLNETIERFLDASGYVLVTVPAFQSLFCQHDVYLQHYRRYRLGQLESVVRKAGLVPIRKGYLFGSLLPVRFASVMLQKLFPPKENQAEGIGKWKQGLAVTNLLKFLLYCDNRLMLFLSRVGIRLPGLSTWVLCKKKELVSLPERKQSL